MIVYDKDDSKYLCFAENGGELVSDPDDKDELRHEGERRGLRSVVRFQWYFLGSSIRSMKY